MGDESAPVNCCHRKRKYGFTEEGKNFDKRWCVKLAAASAQSICAVCLDSFRDGRRRTLCRGRYVVRDIRNRACRAVPGDLQTAGYTGFNCNLKLIGQARGDGANWQTASSSKRANGNICGYRTASLASLPGRALLGSRVLDLTNAGAPQIMGALTTVPMLDPWESIKVNQARQLLAADDAWNGGHGPLIDFYDLSQDCRFPQLLGSVTVGTGSDGGVLAPNGVVGHEGAWAPDGLTYYIGDTTNKSYHAIDVTDPTKPKLITTFDMKTLGLASHGLSISNDGMRGYMTSPGLGSNNGFVILDLSDVQRRAANPQMRLISTFIFNDGSGGTHTHVRSGQTLHHPRR